MPQEPSDCYVALSFVCSVCGTILYVMSPHLSSHIILCMRYVLVEESQSQGMRRCFYGFR